NIEIKTVSPFKAKEWGEIQTDAIPVHYTAQAMHGLMVTNKQVCVFGVLIGGDDFRIYRVERDEETIQAILEKEIAFWDRVKNLNPPEATSVSDVSLMFEKD
ncbi:YqaJ viral recombinase family protein, partial [Escherichia coli]